MVDIRKQVLQFAVNALGTRVWARVHRIPGNKSSLLPLREKYTWQNQEFECRPKTTEWNTDQFHILTDRRRDNDFRGQDRAARTHCDIGVGECWDLAYAALQAHKGLTRVSSYIGNDRKWSNNTVGSLSNVKGGEVLEIKPHLYFFKLAYKEEQGQITAFNYTSNHIGPIPHTAIIKQANTSKGLLEVYHQNALTESGARNLLVHVGKMGVQNLKYNEGGFKILQTCGGNVVNAFVSKFNQISAISNPNQFQTKAKKLIQDVSSYIGTHSSLPNKIKMYIPESRT